jgi:protoporphyrinogen oxidase
MLQTFKTSTKKVAIIGGGISGLTCGYLLGGDKYDVTIFEKSTAGGNFFSEKYNGDNYELGSYSFTHAFFRFKH